MQRALQQRHPCVVLRVRRPLPVRPMRVVSWEQGDRPSVMTRARLQTPQARKRLTDLLAAGDFADLGYVVVDWTGTIAFIDSNGQSRANPDVLDTTRPVMYIQVIKSMPQYGGSIASEHRLDIDDMFGGNDINGSDLIDFVGSLKESVEEMVGRVVSAQGGSR